MTGRIQWLWPENPAQVSLSDRGLAYGDGLFETIRINADGPALLEGHKRRLLLGASLLGIPLTEADWDQWYAGALARGLLGAGRGESFILKLTVTRGSGGRGYRPAANPTPCWATTCHLLPPQPEFPVRTQICQTRLPSPEPAQGAKTLNRLPQVMASRELRDGIYEGLMTDSAGRILEGTRTNLFLIRENADILTPPVQHLAVAGVGREAVVHRLREQRWTVREVPITMKELLKAHELFLVNSVSGVVPVSRVDCRRLPSWSQAEKIRLLCQSLFGS